MDGVVIKNAIGVKITPKSDKMMPFTVNGSVCYKDFGGEEYQDSENCGRVYYCDDRSFIAGITEVLYA
jgi:hypothetical protein